jgi:hypothetical protein
MTLSVLVGRASFDRQNLKLTLSVCVGRLTAYVYIFLNLRMTFLLVVNSCYARHLRAELLHACANNSYLVLNIYSSEEDICKYEYDFNSLT